MGYMVFHFCGNCRFQKDPSLRIRSAKVASHSSGPAVRRHHDRPRTIALEEDVIEIATLARVEDCDREIIQDQQVDADDLAELGLVAVIELPA